MLLMNDGVELPVEVKSQTDVTVPDFIQRKEVELKLPGIPAGEGVQARPSSRLQYAWNYWN